MKQVRIKIAGDRDILVPADMFADFFELLRCCRLVETTYNQPDKWIIEPLIMTYEELQPLDAEETNHVQND